MAVCALCGVHTGTNAGTNLKVGGTSPERSAGKHFLVVPLHFLALKVQLVVLVSAVVMVSTVWSVSCLLFFYSRCSRAQPFVKVGARAPVPHGVGAIAYRVRHKISPKELCYFLCSGPKVVLYVYNSLISIILAVSVLKSSVMPPSYFSML